jgi:hypothetical protein
MQRQSPAAAVAELAQYMRRGGGGGEEVFGRELVGKEIRCVRPSFSSCFIYIICWLSVCPAAPPSCASPASLLASASLPAAPSAAVQQASRHAAGPGLVAAPAQLQHTPTTMIAPNLQGVVA